MSFYSFKMSVMFDVDDFIKKKKGSDETKFPWSKL